jgi:bifunctional DNase/RNase
MLKEAKIFSLVMLPDTGQYLVTLEELRGMRLLPIWIGPAEGMAIAAVLQNHSFPRPLTHDLLINILKSTDIKVDKVVITDLKNDTFYANIILTFDGKSVNIDSRPSDSIAVALRCKVPIFIDEKVFDICPTIHKPITDEEVKKFKKELETLRPEDFFKETKNE